MNPDCFTCLKKPKILLLRALDFSLARQDDAFVDNFLSYNKRLDPVSFVSASSEPDIVIFFEANSYKGQDYSYSLMRSDVVREFADRLYTINIDSVPRGFLPGVYVSLERQRFDALYHAPCAYPYIYNKEIERLRHQQESVSDGAKISPSYLFSFRGSIETHRIRRKIVELFKRTSNSSIHVLNKRFMSHEQAERVDYAKEILESHFVLCPRGISPCSIRLFEAMQLGRCPVIISDDWVPIPDVSWDKCSIRIQEQDIHLLPKILECRLGEAKALGQRARDIWDDHFSLERRYQSYLTSIIKLHSGRSAVSSSSSDEFKRLIHRWRGRHFRSANGWTLRQRIGRQIAKYSK